MQFEELAKKFDKKELPESEVELMGEVPAEAVAEYREAALTHLAEHIELPGFRVGHVPPELALKKVGDMAVLEEAVELLVKELYPKLLEVHHIDVVGRPDIRITKLAPGNPVALTVRVSVYPVVTLPKDWKTFGASIPLEPAAATTDEEVEKTLEDLRQSRRAPASVNTGAGALPELTDEFAKSLGAFESLAHLKEQIKKGIGEEKARAARDARRGKLIDKLLDGTIMAVPRVFVDSELEKIMSQMREDIARMGLKFEDYLKHINKTEEAVRDEFRAQAAKRAKLQLALNKIGADEKLEADPTAVEAELKHALEHFPEANPELVRVHIETVLRNELALKLLEGEISPTEASS